jgi:hypothetical protein
MKNSKKGLSVGIVLTLLAGLFLLALLLRSMGFFDGANKDIKSANSCSTLSGACVASAAQCSTVALKGYGCEQDKPYCCQDQQYNQCSDTTWNTCESCQVKTVNAVYLGSGKNGQVFKVKCAYSTNDVPCAKMTISGRDNVLPADFCTVNQALSTDGEITYDCPGTLLPGDYKLTCGMNAKGTAGIDAKKTCCAASANQDIVVDFKIS